MVNDGTYWLVLDNYLAIPAYDNSATSAAQTTLASGTPFTWSHTASDAKPYVLVAIGAGSHNTIDPSTATASVTFGGTALTDLGYELTWSTATYGFVWVFGGNRLPGGSQTVSVTLTDSGHVFDGYATSYSYDNAIGVVGSLQKNTVYQRLNCSGDGHATDLRPVHHLGRTGRHPGVFVYLLNADRPPR